MSIVTKSFLGAINIVWPGDAAIDHDAWGEDAARDYLSGIVGGDVSPPLPPEKPGEKCTKFTIRPMNYAAYVHYQHLVQHSKYDDPSEDTEVQYHVLRHCLCGIQNGFFVDELGEQHLVQIELDSGVFGRAISSRSWGEHVLPFLDMAVLYTLSLFCVQHSVARLSRTLRSQE